MGKILAVLCVFVVTYLAFTADWRRSGGHNRRTQACSQLDAFATALGEYRSDTGHYPTTAQGLSALRVAPVGEAAWRGPYLQREIPLDPWAYPFVYRSPGEHSEPFEIVSYGPDNRAGGDGFGADIQYSCTVARRVFP